ncbi:hypothetical protein NEIRO03_1457 [Nematocida sp. AWRm78]|nr:hypothetical protein NEIRO02_1659 [Nematocida sp. AWRm79]KAI5183990.1 hypothetical protein NEIRO03_1457 [Nematocida sp. AWRm78]
MKFTYLLLLVSSALVLATDSMKPVYKSKASMYRPYLDRITGRLVFGTMQGGCNVVSMGNEAGVHLTQSTDNSYGSVTAKHPIAMDNWKMDIHVSVKRGAQGMGIWFTKDFNSGTLFGGSPQFNGLLVFMAMSENTLTDKYPMIGIATAYGGAPVVHFSKKVDLVQNCMISLKFVNGVLSVMYGGRDKEVKLIEEMRRVSFDDGTRLTISGQVADSDGDINIKSISVFKMHRPRRIPTVDEIPKTRQKMTWLIFGAVLIGVGYYVYKQRTVKQKHKGILQQ